ncbi:unnamed protein product [Dracunculus medinensis]|uniref:tRNA (cytosine(34)-C(5))-methyltransferase n=1 Tax=Dracunculus medinensis TaxID=318479 RepID=A0A0N4U7G8_DRAME|nr:unnamed protein product [Dracunculus medinensis]
MGKHGIRGRKRKKVADSQRKGAKQNYVLATNERSNMLFFEFYKLQRLINDDEWDSFVDCLKSDLPTSFRIRGCHREAETLIKIMNERYFTAMINLSENGISGIHVPQSLPWYPQAFQTIMPRNAIRKTVSMIPPLLLNIKPHHNVLDMCAAPGSKTMQIVEIMHDLCDSKTSPEGIIVANDVDNTRCYLLVRQVLKRMPVSNCIVINEDAAHLPDMFLNEEPSDPLLFDRILCDVMCSGDGTFRKNIDLWSSWKPQNALGLHKLQINISRRALQLLAVNGIMVYSTCSLNPLEDEAVVASLLRYGEGAVELIDVSNNLLALKRSPGVSQWKVYDKDLTEITTPSDVPECLKKLIVQSMFPPNAEEKEKFHLNRCFRILPHSQNTGGFFVAVLRKLKSLGNKTFTTPASSAPLAKRRKIYKEEPFIFLANDDDRWKDISQYYGVKDSFRSQNLFGRIADSERRRTLYYVNDSARRFIQYNNKIKIINAGLRMFGRVESKFVECRFRLSQDGVKVILPYITKRILNIDVEDMYNLLQTTGKFIPREKLKCSEKLNLFTPGSLVLVCSIDGMQNVVCTWLGSKTISPFVGKEESIHMIRMLGYDTTEMENQIFKKDKGRRQKLIDCQTANDDTEEIKEF